MVQEETDSFGKTVATLNPLERPLEALPTTTPAGQPITATYVKDVLIPQSTSRVMDAKRAYDNWAASQSAAGRRIDEKDGTVFVYKNTDEVPTLLADGTELAKTTPVIDREGASLYRAWKGAEAELSQYNTGLKAGTFGAVNTGKSFVDSEQDKTKEVKRRFVDFLDTAESLYKFQDDEQKFSMNAINENIKQEEALKKGYLDSGWDKHFVSDRPGPRVSSMLQDRLPTDIMPDYRPGGTGVPGEGEYADTFDSPGNYSGLIGFANGTGGLPLGDPAAGVDEEIAWMIPMGDYPVTPGFKPVPVPKSWMLNKANKVRA